jgi:hypothetical protein
MKKSQHNYNDGWMQGFAAACAISLRNHRKTTEIRETYACNFMTEKELREHGVDEFDIDILKPIVEEIQSLKRRIKK